jgi:hypothetical protein
METASCWHAFPSTGPSYISFDQYWRMHYSALTQSSIGISCDNLFGVSGEHDHFQTDSCHDQLVHHWREVSYFTQHRRVHRIVYFQGVVLNVCTRWKKYGISELVDWVARRPTASFLRPRPSPFPMSFPQHWQQDYHQSCHLCLQVLKTARFLVAAVLSTWKVVLTNPSRRKCSGRVYAVSIFLCTVQDTRTCQ